MSTTTPIKHLVQPGETLSLIAQQYGVSESEIRNYHNQNAPLDDLMGNPNDFTNSGKLDYVLIPPKEEESTQDEYVPTQEDDTEDETSSGENHEEENQEEEQEQSGGAASEHDKKYVVIQKGQAQCSQGTDFPQFKVISHQLQHANGEETDHLIVTEDDVMFNPPATPFAKAKCQYLTSQNNGTPTPCAYAPGGKWKKTYEKLKVMDKSVVTELSELDCPIIPPEVGKITIFKHGQTQQVSTGHFNNVELEELQAISPLANKPELELPKVAQIEANLPAQNDKSEKGSGKYKKPVFKSGSNDSVTEITVRMDESIEFNVIKYDNPKNADKSKVSWKVFNGFDWVDSTAAVFGEIGENLKVNFDAPGKYRVLAYGSDDPKKQADNRCAMDVHVVVNSLNKDTKGIKSSGESVSGSMIRKGFPAVFQPDFKLSPATSEEKARVEMGVKDASGNIVDAQFSAETGLTFTPVNSIKYTVWIQYTNEMGERETHSKSFDAKSNTVDAIQANPPSDKYRPGTTVNFTVSKMRFSPLENDPDYAKIKWNIDGVTSPTTGKSISHRFDKEGKFIVEAYMNSANNLGTDSYTVKVMRNSVYKIKTNKHPKAGTKGIFQVETYELGDYDKEKDGEHRWVVEGPSPGTATGGAELTHKFTLPGSYTIKCFIGEKGCKEPLKIEVKQPKINVEKCCWIDQDTGSGNKITKAGYGQEVCAFVDSEGLENEEITLEVYDNDNIISGKNIVYDPKTQLKDGHKNGFYWPFKLDDEIKKKIEGTGATSYGDLYFKIKPTDANLKIINGDTNLAEYLRVSATPEFVNAYFTDARDKNKIRLCKQTEPLYFKTYATNYVGKKVKVHFLTESEWYLLWKPMELHDWADIKDKFSKENFFHTEEAEFNDKGEILVQVPISKLGKPTNYFKINAAIELPAEEGDEAQGFYIDHGNIAHIYVVDAKVEELKKTHSPLIVDRVDIKSGGGQEEETNCECEARVRAFLRMIRIGEGTQDDGGYTRIVGGSSFADHEKDMSDHPKVYISKHDSTAAGAYQITKTNWNDASFKKWRDDNKITDFSKVSQDIYGVYLVIKKKGALNEIKNKDLKGAVDKCKKEWASLPGAGYGQREERFETIQKKYDEFLKEELEGSTTLYLKKGFLKDIFNITCCTSNNQNGETKQGYDIDKAVAYVISNAKTQKPYGDCALYVRKAINEGGISGSWGDAWQYITALPTIGFTDLGKITEFKKGDIVVFNKTGGRKWGHIAMWTGSQWVSDFKQNSILVHDDYDGKDYHVFRWQ